MARSLDVKLEVKKGQCYARAKAELEDRSKIGSRRS